MYAAKNGAGDGLGTRLGGWLVMRASAPFRVDCIPRFIGSLIYGDTPLKHLGRGSSIPRLHRQRRGLAFDLLSIAPMPASCGNHTGTADMWERPL